MHTLRGVLLGSRNTLILLLVLPEFKLLFYVHLNGGVSFVSFLSALCLYVKLFLCFSFGIKIFYIFLYFVICCCCHYIFLHYLCQSCKSCSLPALLLLLMLLLLVLLLWPSGGFNFLSSQLIVVRISVNSTVAAVVGCLYGILPLTDTICNFVNILIKLLFTLWLTFKCESSVSQRIIFVSLCCCSCFCCCFCCCRAKGMRF